MTHTSSRTRGFTLVEIMIVVLILGILLAIAVPNFLTARTVSRTSECLANLKELNTAKEQFGMENGLITGSPVNDAADLVPVYIEQWPIGPISGTYSANPIGSDPTFNSQNSNAIQAECSATTMTTQCPF